MSCSHLPVSDINWKKVSPTPQSKILSAVSCMHNLFQMTLQHLNRMQIWALTWPFQNSSFFTFQPVLGEFIGMFWVIVMLQGLVLLTFFDRWSHMFLKHLLIQCRIHSGFNDGELARSYCSKASPNHDTFTSMLHSWFEVLLLKCFI